MEYLKVCWFCGSEFEDIEKCHICRQEFCSSHLKPQFHDCPGEVIQNPYKIDFEENNFDKLDNNQEIQLESNYHTDFDTTESVVNYYQCWFCGIGISEIFYCEKCNQYYCGIHKELEKHDCISLFDQSKIESHLPIQEENFNKTNENEQLLHLKVNQLAYFIKVIFSIINHQRLLAKLDRIIDHWVKISYRHVGISTMNPTYSFVKNPEAISHLNEEFSSHFTSMKKDVEKHVLGQKKELLPLKECIIPVLGIVICPDIRMFGALDWFFSEKEQEIQTEFAYYQLKLKDD